jgi:hypothetical protein
LDRYTNLQKSCLETLWKPLKTISVRIFRNYWCGFLEFFKCVKNSLKLPYQCREIGRLIFVRLRIGKTWTMDSCLADADFGSLHMTCSFSDNRIGELYFRRISFDENYFSAKFIFGESGIYPVVT